ncbi:MAG: hypothetical protein COW47_01260 [Candidatus Huberarchaeum crystalense]|uniref:tRNA (guanine(26)-N(2))-dimethyltransferase n=1 Tax=Huberarchaeum crystalense TaxID=2014257 RepID=A0A2G9LIQ7_HUBC1|nr:hypothetical protein [archaeon]OIP20834.1 MAG: hypothetical protein AUJ91_00090 [archaeon CG2_30_31_98]PIN66419.1 MAG: hypothetical protein COW69_02485 [Candidatus Huberarchaeum crystalense]NCS98209.1 hypothetical protein [archaeon]PIV13565.1 MAG: hypothetical protein COS45_02335 [Candidatus Huberarchaeum crystalense]
MTLIKEGNVVIDVSDADYGKIFVPSKKMKVFYNPRMKHNRDISVLFYDFWAKAVKKSENLVFFDGMAGSGVKGLRVLAETGIKNVIFNDLNPKSIENIKSNLKINNLPKNIHYNLYNLSFQRLLAEKQADIVDLDPFGTPVLFLDFVLANARKGELISITATDTAVLCGASQQNSQKCERIYFSTPSKNESMKETGLRILLGYIARTAAKYGLFPLFLLSYSKDHYMRAFFSIEKYKQGDLDRKIGHISFCAACNKRKVNFEQCFSYVCECGANLTIAGPLWLGNFIDMGFYKEIDGFVKKQNKKIKFSEKTKNTTLNTQQQLRAVQKFDNLLKFMKPLAAEQNFLPWHYNLHNYPNYAHKKIDQALQEIKGVRSHFDPLAVKTNKTNLFEKS